MINIHDIFTLLTVFLLELWRHMRYDIIIIQIRWMNVENKKAFIINILYYGIILFFAYLGIKYLFPVLIPFLIAFIVVWLLKHPAFYLADKWKLKKKWVLIPMLTLIYVSVFLLIVKVGSNAASVVGNFILQIPSIYAEQILPALQNAYQHISVILQETNPDLVLEFESLFQEGLIKIGAFISNSSGSIVRTVSGYAASVPSVFVKIVIAIISSYFIASDYDHIIEFVLNLLPGKWREKVVRVAEQTKNIIWIFLRSYSILMMLTFVELSIGLSLLKIPYALLISLIIAVFDILPILGTGGVLIPWAIIAALIGDYGMAAGILVLYVVITAIRNTLEPKIVGKQIGLHPLATLISMFIGARLFGIIGLFGFPVTLSIIVRMRKMEQN